MDFMTGKAPGSRLGGTELEGRDQRGNRQESQQITSRATLYPGVFPLRVTQSRNARGVPNPTGR